MTWLVLLYIYYEIDYIIFSINWQSLFYDCKKAIFALKSYAVKTFRDVILIKYNKFQSHYYVQLLAESDLDNLLRLINAAKIWVSVICTFIRIEENLFICSWKRDLKNDDVSELICFQEEKFVFVINNFQKFNHLDAAAIICEFLIYDHNYKQLVKSQSKVINMLFCWIDRLKLIKYEIVLQSNDVNIDTKSQK